MRHRIRRLTGLILSVLVLAGCATPAFRASNPGDVDSLSRQILVTTRQSNSGAEGLLGDPATIYLRRPGYGPTPAVDRLLDGIAADYRLQRREGWLISSLGVYCEVYELGPGQNIDDVVHDVAMDPRVESVQAMNVYQTEGVHYDDPYHSMQPALTQMSIDSAHEFATGRGVTIAVVDSLVDDRHPEIRGHIPVSRNLVKPGLQRAEIHGTAVAGVIVSTPNNGQGIVGVAPDARVFSLRACWTVDSVTGRALCSSFSLARALESATELGARIVNMSLAGPRDPLVERLIDSAIERGVIVIAARAGRDDASAGFPASHPGVIPAVAFGIETSSGAVAIAAPGTDVLSTVPDSEYGFFSGNSMASAFVAGVTALLVERRPDIDARQARELLAGSSEGGMVDACRALALLQDGESCVSPATPRPEARD